MLEPAQRERVRQLFDACRDLPVADRASRTAAGAAGDAEVETEVLSLLAAYDRSADFLEQPAMRRHAGVVADVLRSHDELAPGTRVGHFEVVAPLGRGGMGMVYRARDTELLRDVALKLLPPDFAGDAGRQARFQDEARAVAALNHPNVAAIYAVERGALVMELVEGPTLQERLRAGALPLDETLRIARQIADAIDAAHSRGIVHRDLKPANIKLTTAGTVKVLDFGLAKAAGRAARDGTEPGTIMGTAGYAAPEQAAGQPVDKRADIWAFGVVLYEMLSGTPLFDGDTSSHRMAAVLTKEPDLAPMAFEVRRLLQACLQKDPQQRLRDIGDWAALIETAPPPPRPPPVRGVGTVLPWAIAAIALLAAATILLGGRRMVRTPPAPPQRADLVIAAAPDHASFALSPDGTRVVFVSIEGGTRRLWLRALDARVAQPLPGTDNAFSPFWSPDGRAVGFFADLQLKRIDLDGVQPQVLARVPAITSEGTWGRGVILYSSGGVAPIYRIADTGGAVAIATVLQPGQNNQLVPRFLPDGRQFFYVVNGSDPALWLASLDGGAPRRITPITVTSDSGAEYLAPGWLVRVRQNLLEAQRFDSATGQLVGEPVILERSVETDTGMLSGSFSASPAGTIVWRTSGGDQRQLGWFDATGHATGTVGDVADSTLFSPEISPDGKRVLTMRGAPGSTDLWVQDGSRNSRLTFAPADDRLGIWSPDGARIAFTSNRDGTYDLYDKPANGSGEERRLLHSPEIKRPNAWSPDGRFILYTAGQDNGDLFVLPLGGERKPLPLVSTPFNEQQGAFSPDGQWVAFQSDQSGRFEIYARPFPGSGAQVQLSVDGGHSPRWRKDGKAIFYLGPDLRMMTAAVAFAGAELTAGAPVALFQTAINQATNRQQYDVATDGRFLILTELQNRAAEPLRLLLNWTPPSP